MDCCRIVYAPAAMDDLRSVFSYIAYNLKARQAAINQIDRIRSKVRSLDKMPERYAKVDWEPWASMGVRKMPAGNYIIFYLFNNETLTVTVLRIFYGGRNIECIINSDNEQ